MPPSPLQDVLGPLLAAAAGASGVAVAARCGTDRTVLLSGTTAHHGSRPVAESTRFEIGSLTKTFTALLLAEMAARGEVGYDDPIGKHLPFSFPATPITLLHLATHTSGLPRLPPGLLRRAVPFWFSNPYRDFGPADLMAAIRHQRPSPAPGTRVRYSNFAVGLLGQLLAHRAGCCFEDLVTSRVLRPLGLSDTSCATAPQATGYWHARARPAWQIPGLPAAGALRSTVEDMLRYLDAHLTPTGTPLEAALTDVTRPRLVIPGSADHLCLIWNCRHRPGHELLFHSGGTRGFTSFAGFSPETRTALVALANTGPTLRSSFIQRAYNALRTLAARPHCPTW
jgi:D-alanyl-D-alanine-carboxypeptidase/D-alanyl-D-alanine-endopeptidase